MYRKLIKPILFAMNIERAHSTVLFLLRMIGKIPGGRAPVSYTHLTLPTICSV